MFGERIKTFRKTSKMTQIDLAKILGVSGRCIGYYEKEERVPPQDILQKIADYFSTSVDYLLGRTNIKVPLVKDLDSDLAEAIGLLNEAHNCLSKIDQKLMIDLMKAFVQNKKG